MPTQTGVNMYSKAESLDEVAGRFKAEEEMMREASRFLEDLFMACDEIGCGQDVLDHIVEHQTEFDLSADLAYEAFEATIDEMNGVLE